MRKDIYYVVRAYDDLRGRVNTHDIVAGPFITFSDAEVWIAAEPKYIQKELEVHVQKIELERTYS